jgi:hypothetical protein
MRSRFGRQAGGISFFAFQDIITGTSGFLIVLALFLALNLEEKLSEATAQHPYAKREEDLKSMQTQILLVKQQVADWEQAAGLDDTTLRRMIGQLKTSLTEMDARPLPGMNQDADATGRDATLRAEKRKLLTRLDEINASIHKGEQLSSGLVKDIPDVEKKIINAQSSLQRKRQLQNVITLIPEPDGRGKEPILVLVQSSLIRFQRANSAPADGGSVTEFSNYLRQTSPTTHYVVIYFKPSGAQHFELLTKRARAEGYEIGYDVIPEDFDVEFRNDASLKQGGKL